MEARDIIIAPVLTEKSYQDIANKKYVFEVEVESVHTMNCRGKKKRMGRYEGFTPSYKKAIVQLKKDSKSIAFFDSLS